MPDDAPVDPNQVDIQELEKTQKLLDEAAATVAETNLGGSTELDKPADEAETAKPAAPAAAPVKKKKGGGCCGGGKAAAEEPVQEEEVVEAPKSLRERLTTQHRSPGKVLADRRKAKEIVVDTLEEVAQRFSGLWVQQGVVKAKELAEQVGVSDYQQQAMTAVKYGAGRSMMKVSLDDKDTNIMQIETFGMGRSVKQEIKIGVDDYVSQKLMTFDGPLDCKAKWTDKKLELLVYTRWGQEIQQIRHVSPDNEEIIWEITYDGVTCRRFWRRIGMPDSDESWNVAHGDDIEEACELIQGLGRKVTPPEQLELYGYFKQGLFGDHPTGKADARLGSHHVAKHNAWIKHKGMPKEEAEKTYVQKVQELLKKHGVDPSGGATH
ncbi:unnamed protein product [Amoebophrya sp. A120]|nr:unnamed protein product [Amoebophrya sp. A120]|eukprot:GSA120T00012500001.1